MFAKSISFDVINGSYTGVLTGKPAAAANPKTPDYDKTTTYHTNEFQFSKIKAY
jgi:hypothetical protein